MDLLVLGEVRALVEAPATLGALVWTLPSVDALVGDESGAHTEALAALVALVWLFPCVDPLMFHQR